MKNLDCTLRDGGYYTNWDFNEVLVENYFHAMSLLPIEYIELGYRNKALDEYYGQFYYCPEYLMRKAKSILKDKKLAVMLNAKSLKPTDIKELLTPCLPFISMIRLAVDPKSLEKAIILAKPIKEMGFEVGFNIMYMTKWKEIVGFFDLLPLIEGLVDYLYLVDSYGGILPEEVKDIVLLVKEKVTVPLGFHGHNNLELALINSLTAVNNGCSIVDSTILGMGRGAGNLKTELLLTYLSSKTSLQVQLDALSQTVSDFESLKVKYEWGTNLPYMVSGANSLPQEEVMDWIQKRAYSIESIMLALENRKVNSTDNVRLPIFNPLKFSVVLIIGGGDSAINHSMAVKEFISTKSDVCIIHASSKNSKYYSNLKNVQHYFCLVGNEGLRLEQVLSNFTDSIICVLPPFPRKMGTYIPIPVRDSSFELENINFTEKYQDAHTSIALQIAKDINPDKIFLIGYDGYIETVMNTKEQDLMDENTYLFERFQKVEKGICALAPTRYNIKVESVYSLI